MSDSVPPGLLQFLWGLLLLPLGWLWARINGNQDAIAATNKELEQHKLHLANNHFDKTEVKDIIRGTVKPIEDSVKRIEDSVNKLIDREMNARRGGDA